MDVSFVRFVAVCGAILAVSAGCKSTGSSGVAAKKSQPDDSANLTPSPTGGTPYWVQLGPDGVTLVKALTSSSSCPALVVDGATVAMQSRSTPNATFSVLVCQATLPAGAKAASLAGNALALPKVAPNKILIVGDTGCEIKPDKGKVDVQVCNDPSKWAWAQVAATAAKEKPDLVIHVGDYHYREIACPDGNAGCSGAFVGDNWSSWDQDFFTPATPLLEAAPWVFARGNHELCARAGNGWFYLLDPRPFQGVCTDNPPPYTMRVGEHTIAVVDAADDANIQPSLNKLPVVTDSILWLVQHRPFLTPGIDDETTVPTPTFPAAYQGSGKVGAVIAGHAHRLDLNVFTNGNPPELISGNGGTTLENSHLPGKAVVGQSSQTGYFETEYYDYGYLTLERQSQVGLWNMIVHDRSGAAVFNCDYKEGVGQQTTVSCKQMAH